MLQREQILQQAMQLTPEDRAYVADVLEQSLGDGGFATKELADEWATEIKARLEAHDRGESTAIEQDVALDRIRQKLAEFRARKVQS